MMIEESPVRRGRQPKVEATASNDLPVRRRNKAFDHSGVLKMFVNESKKDARYDYRWINEGENGARLTLMTVQDDWDKVPESEMGHPTKVAVGTQKSGKPEYAYLCKKRKEFVDEDRRAKHDRSVERMNALRRGQTGQADALSPGDKNNTYIPDEGISISD